MQGLSKTVGFQSGVSVLHDAGWMVGLAKVAWW